MALAMFMACMDMLVPSLLESSLRLNLKRDLVKESSRGQ